MQDSVEGNQFQDGCDQPDERDNVVASLPRNDVSKSPSLREPSKQRKPALVCSVREAWGSANSTEKMDERKNQHVRFSSSRYGFCKDYTCVSKSYLCTVTPAQDDHSRTRDRLRKSGLYVDRWSLCTGCKCVNVKII